jgi:hypothetical protein
MPRFSWEHVKPEDAMRRAITYGTDLLDTFIEHEQMQRTPQQWRQAIMFDLIDKKTCASRTGDQLTELHYQRAITFLMIHWRVRKLLTDEQVMEDRADERGS